MSAEDEKRMATKEKMMIQTAMVVRLRRLEWFGQVKRRDETVAVIKTTGKGPRGRPRLIHGGSEGT